MLALLICLVEWQLSLLVICQDEWLNSWIIVVLRSFVLWKVISLEHLLTWWALDILSVSPPDISRIGTKLGDFTGYWLYSGTNLYNNGGKEIQFIGRQSQSVITLSVTLSEQVSVSVVIASYPPQAGWSACPVCLVRPAGHRFATRLPSWLDFNKTNKCWTTNYAFFLWYIDKVKVNMNVSYKLFCPDFLLFRARF